MRVVLGGCHVDLLERRALLEEVTRRLAASADEPLLVVASANLDHVHHVAATGAPWRGATGVQWLVTIDGRPVQWAARRRTGRWWPLLTGSDLLPVLLGVASDRGAVVGFLGGTVAQHDGLRRWIAVNREDLVVGGYWSPPRDVVEDPVRSTRLAAEVAAAGVDLLVVGLGKPRQEQWLADHGRATGARVALAFGAAADFLAGTARRAPVGWRRAGAEWAWRLLHEPRRLARRYLVEGPPSLALLVRDSAPPEGQ